MDLKNRMWVWFVGYRSHLLNISTWDMSSGVRNPGYLSATSTKAIIIVANLGQFQEQKLKVESLGTCQNAEVICTGFCWVSRLHYEASGDGVEC